MTSASQERKRVHFLNHPLSPPKSTEGLKTDKMIAMCGLVCNDCFAFIAKQENNDSMREKAAELWSTEKERLKISEIDCDGCLAGKALYKFCLVCDVRKCGLERSIKNCANCDRFPCEKLENLWRDFRTVSREVARANLEKIRSD